MEKNIGDFFAKHTKLELSKGKILLKAYEEPDGIYYLKKGYVKQYDLSSKGEPVMIHIFRPGSFFPLSWALNDKVPVVTHESLTNLTVYRSSKKELKSWLAEHPEELMNLTKRLMAGLVGLTRRVESLAAEGARRKTLEALLYLAENIGQKNQKQVIIPVDFPHREMASWIGTTRETATLQVESLMKKGLISSKHGKIKILDFDKLKKEISY